MRDINPVGKEGWNEMQRFKFRKIDDFIDSLHPAMVKNGVILIPRKIKYEKRSIEVTRSSGKTGIDTHVELDMEYDLYAAEDGSKLTVGPFPGEAIDSGDKATTKALTAAYKYFLIETFIFPLVDMVDADSESHDVKSVTPNQPITNKPKIIGGDFMIPASKTFGPHQGKKVKDVPVDGLKKILEWCKEKKIAPDLQKSIIQYLCLTPAYVSGKDDIPPFDEFDK